MTGTTLCTTALLPETEGSPDDKAIAFYRDHGFVRIRGIISPGEADVYREAALDISDKDQSFSGGSIFEQHVNVWTKYPEIRGLTFHARIAEAAQTLAGAPLRLWHDQILIKKPHNNIATEFHQDQPYWPHANSTRPISCWVALCDVPVERGCMTFLPGSHLRTDLDQQNLNDDRSLFGIAPDLEYSSRVTVPLRKGDCTFHHGRCAHMATPNFTGDPRVAHVVIFVDAATSYDGRPHCVTDGIGLNAGDQLTGALFPAVSEFASQP